MHGGEGESGICAVIVSVPLQRPMALLAAHSAPDCNASLPVPPAQSAASPQKNHAVYLTKKRHANGSRGKNQMYRASRCSTA